MISIIKKYKSALTVIGAISVLTVCYFQQRELSKLRTELKIVKSEKDSLHDENFACQTEITRHQLAYDILVERNPKAAEEYSNVLSQETE